VWGSSVLILFDYGRKAAKTTLALVSYILYDCLSSIPDDQSSKELSRQLTHLTILIRYTTNLCYFIHRQPRTALVWHQYLFLQSVYAVCI
jgi:hypothetical protein